VPPRAARDGLTGLALRCVFRDQQHLVRIALGVLTLPQLLGFEMKLSVRYWREADLPLRVVISEINRRSNDIAVPSFISSGAPLPSIDRHDRESGI
jgi:hypothetical protein